MNNRISAMTIISILFIANPNKYIERVNSWTEVFIFARNGKSDATKVTFLAKIKTSVQLSTLSIYLFGLAINNMLMIVIADILLFISLFITLYTGFIYTLNSFRKNEELQ